MRKDIFYFFVIFVPLWSYIFIRQNYFHHKCTKHTKGNIKEILFISLCSLCLCGYFFSVGIILTFFYFIIRFYIKLLALAIRASQAFWHFYPRRTYA